MQIKAVVSKWDCCSTPAECYESFKASENATALLNKYIQIKLISDIFIFIINDCDSEENTKKEKKNFSLM